MYHFGFKKTIDYFQRRRMTKRKIKEQVGDKTKKIDCRHDNQPSLTLNLIL